jgi:alpha-beta hydrolase superfamily lysophospholipase
MTTATSADGTPIEFVTYGDGPPLVIVGGATSTKEAAEPIAEALAGAGFTAVAIDRRGRGGSGDTRPFHDDSEVEDLAAVIAVVADGGPAAVHSHSSGAALALRAAAAGVPITTLSAFEPPYRVEGAPTPPDDYVAHLQELYDAERPEEMLEYFLTAGVGQPQAAVDAMKDQPMWAGLVALGHTTLYDARVLGDSRVPTALLASVSQPVLTLGSTGSPQWLQDAAIATADAVPDGRYESLAGEFHTAPPTVLAPVLAAFHTMG